MKEGERSWWRTREASMPFSTLESAMALTITSLDPSHLYAEDSDVDMEQVVPDKQVVELKVSCKIFNLINF